MAAAIMSDAVLREKDVICRKPHSCAWCGQTIPKYGKARFQAGVYDHEMYNHWLHPECEEAMRMSAMYEDWEVGAQERGKTLEECYQ